MQTDGDSPATERPFVRSAFKQEEQSPAIQTAHLRPMKVRQTSSPVSPAAPVTSAPDGLRVGSVIEHQRFGIGTVANLEGTGENMKATVSFKNTGQKILLLKFARYTIIG